MILIISVRISSWCVQEMEKIGISDDGFSGVPVFQVLFLMPNIFFLISNKNTLKRRRVSPEYAGSIRQGQKQIKCIKYKVHETMG